MTPATCDARRRARCATVRRPRRGDAREPRQPRLVAVLLLSAGLAAGASPVRGAAENPTADAVPVVPAAEPRVDPALLARAEALLAAGRAAEAYAVLEPQAVAAAGDFRFDQLLASAALAAGHAGAAIAPLRRVLRQEPRFEGGRLDLARALRDSGQHEAARAEYLELLRSSLSETTRRMAQRGLDGLAAVPAWTPAVTLGAGYDSNANIGASGASFMGFTLDPRSVRQQSPFIEAGAALQGRHDVGEGMQLLTQLRAGHRLDSEARFVDQSVAEGGSTLQWRRGPWLAATAVDAAWILLDGRSYAGAGYLEASLSRGIGTRWEIAGLVRGGIVDYRQDGYEPLDVERYLWGGALQRLGLHGGSARLGLALLGGRDIARRQGSPYSNDRWGARLFGAWQLDARRGLFGELSWLTSDFYGAQGFLGVDRLDRQYVGSLGLELRDWPLRGWSAAPQLRATLNRSNVPVFEFDRIEAAVFLRRELR